MYIGTEEFREVVLADFEFSAAPGEPPSPVCLVAHELVSGRRHRIFEEDLRQMRSAPYPTGPDSLFVAYYASAEVGCHLALEWLVPARILDLYTEFRKCTNGRDLPCGAGLVGAMVFYGLGGIDSVEKDAMRLLALRGGPWTEAEKLDLLDYCESDVFALQKLLSRMQHEIDLPRALQRGRFMSAAARIENCGVPIDKPALDTLRARWEQIKARLVQRVDANYGVFDGLTFKADRWAQWLVRNDIPWPLLESGELALDDDTFREMARANPTVAPIREIRYSLAQLRLEELAVGSDGRNRTLLSAFRARTGRNQPSNTKFIFGPATWLRGLIRPEAGAGIAYIDWSQQEFGIAAALSGDANMLSAYTSGDPYLAFAKQAGAVPQDATKKSHAAVRDRFKACVLGVQYSMGADALALRIGQPPAFAHDLLRMHRKTYAKFWAWSDAAVTFAMLHNKLYTVFGWEIHVGRDVNTRSLRNFPMQANGAEMLRLACSLATERGIRVCAPVHDALLVEAPLGDLDAAVTQTQQAMSDASAIVLGGFRLRSDAKLVCYPDRYEDERGREMWKKVWETVAEVGKGEAGSDADL